jgi:eukaryotic-like serine/threonine-protein kinase
MSLRDYLKSKVFIAQLITVFAIIAVVAYMFFHWITFYTRHGEEITVPDLSKLSVEQAEEKLASLNLDYIVLDTVDYRPEFPKLSIVEQEPKAGAKVKDGRKVYIKVNADKYTMVAVPDLIEKTYRQAVPTLSAAGLQEGTITYKPYLGKDMVLEMRMDGLIIKPGTKVFKNSKIDLVLGDGKIKFDENAIDSLNVEMPEIEP